MEKRLVLFLVLSVVIITGNVLIRSVLFPPQKVAQQEDAKEPDKDDPVVAGKKEGAPDEPGQKELGAKDAKTGDVVPGDPEAEDPNIPQEGPAQPEAKAPPDPKAMPEWFTMGSFAPGSGSRLLVTYCNRGAAVERVELVERDAKGRLRYRDLIRTNGYLGLDVRTAREGCVVKVVRPGTPADTAANKSGPDSGFKVGDLIVSVAGVGVGSADELDAVLEDSKPGDEATFDVRRDGATLQLVAKLDRWPLQLIQPETKIPLDEDLENALMGRAGELADGVETISSYLVGLHSVGSMTRRRGQDELSGVRSLRRSNWELAASGPNEIVFSLQVPVPESEGGGVLEFLKRYKMAPLGKLEEDGKEPSESAKQNPHIAYHLQMNVEVRNLGEAAQEISYVMDGPNGLPLEGWWYTNKIHPSWGSAGARDVVWRVNGNKHSLRSATQIVKQVKEAVEEDDPNKAVTSLLTDNPTPAERTLDYVGVDTQYFSAVMLGGTIAEPTTFTCLEAQSMPVGDVPQLSGRGMKKLNTTYRLVSVPVSIEPGSSVTEQYHLFLGPKSTEVLADYDLADMIEYGWFGRIARPLSWLLHAFYGIFRNYGLAIVLLTVLVRGAMFPIGRKAARNAQIMQELAPEIKKIKEKYKNDLEKQGQAQRELWKKHNFNPLSGCWLMFLQLPIFIGLYRCLSVDIHLRQAPLIPGIDWCSNLAGPDMAWRWQGIMPDFLAAETGWLGPYLNILPIITIVLFVAQQKMFTPPATDDQTRMQQSMMKYMMVFMGFLFFKVPAGLCVYFIASSLWGIGERKLLPKPDLNAAKEEPTPQVTKQTSAGKGKKQPIEEKKKSWLDRLREKADSEAADAARQRHKRRK